MIYGPLLQKPCAETIEKLINMEVLFITNDNLITNEIRIIRYSLAFAIDVSEKVRRCRLPKKKVITFYTSFVDKHNHVYRSFLNFR